MRKNSLLKLALIGTLVTSFLSADYKIKENLEIKQILEYESGVVRVDFKESYLEGTCSSWGYRFAVNSNVEGGKRILAKLDTALLLGKKITIAYITSETPDTQNEACTDMADIIAVITRHTD